jgi:AcrR family transcriptional regulator
MAPLQQIIPASSTCPEKVKGSSQAERLLAGMIAAGNRHGYAGASVSRVVAEAGVSRATFYEHFADKDDCFLATHREIAERLLEQIRYAVHNAPPEQALQATIRRLIAHAEETPAHARFLVNEALAGGPRALEERDRVVSQMQATVEGARANAEPHTPMPDLPSGVLIGAAHWLLATRLRRGERDLRELTNEVVRWIERYERPRSDHRWDKLTPGPSPSASLYVSELPLSAPPPIPAGRPRLSSEEVLRNQRERIMYATAEVAARKGYCATHVTDIASAARVDRRVFYTHFRDKQQAFLSVHELGFQQTMAVGAGAFSSRAAWPERIWQGIVATTQFHATLPSIAHVGYVEAHALGATAIQRIDDSRQAFTIFLQEGNQQTSPPQSRIAMESIVAAIFEIGYRQCRHGRVRQLPRLAYHAAYLALAPFLGADATDEFLGAKLREGKLR